jgi:hypothetical protein
MTGAKTLGLSIINYHNVPDMLVGFMGEGNERV